MLKKNTYSISSVSREDIINVTSTESVIYIVPSKTESQHQ